MPSQFEEDTYNVKKILGHRTHRERLLFKVGWVPRIGIPRSPLKPSYLPTTRFGGITCRNRISPKPFTSSPTLVDHSHERATEKALTNMGIYCCLGKGGESRSGGRQEESVKKKKCMHGAPLGYKNPHRSRALGTACLPHCLPLSPLKA